MASIPCAAYQVTYIHDNLRRKHRSAHATLPLPPHQVRAIEQLSGGVNTAVLAGPPMMDKTNNQWLNPKAWGMPWLNTLSTSVPANPVPAK